MSQPPQIMLGTELPDIDRWSDRVVVALGQNPSVFTGPGTNTYLVGTGAQRILLDTGQGIDTYGPVLDRAFELAGCEGLQEIVLTHGHPDHMGGVEQIWKHCGKVPVKKYPWPESDEHYDFPVTTIEDGTRVETEGATLRAVLTPGHAPDHLCFMLEEEGSIFSGDNVLGVGTTVIPEKSGSLSQYMASLERILEEAPKRIYPAHGPCIEDGVAKIREYIAHRQAREEQILAALQNGASAVREIVRVVYAAYPEALHAAAGQSVSSHLLKLANEAKVSRSPADAETLAARWRVA